MGLVGLNCNIDGYNHLAFHTSYVKNMNVIFRTVASLKFLVGS